ncbi:hypothetical protein F52700_7054 [Fusarium sp. NRRL 52700]|nr:hypothetical protein F52700_7054 [Fusarium sp. NRRL 52700]
MGFHLSSLVASAALLRASYAFSVTENTDGNVLASAIFGNGISVISASFTGASVSSGTFTDGPFGMGDAAILTSGAAVGALPNGDHYVNNGAAGSVTYCGGSSSNNAAILTADVMIAPGFGGMRFEVVMASEEFGGAPDAIGIFVNNQNYALDGNGNRLTAVSPWLLQPLIIAPPNSVTSYPGSSAPYWIDVPSLSGGSQTVVVAICDAGDAEWDSALMIKAEACADCNEPVRLAYVTTTTTLAAGDTPYTSTITASGTVSGTIEIGEATSKETTTMTTPEETTTATAKETTFTVSGTITDLTTGTTTDATTDTTMDTTTDTTMDTTTDVMETSIEASGPVTSKEPPNSTVITADTTSVERSDTLTEYSTIVIESTTTPTSATATKTPPTSSNDSTTSLETTRLSESSIDSPTTSREEVQVSSAILAAPTSTDEVTLSMSDDLSSESATIANSPGLTAKLASIQEMTTTESLETSATEEMLSWTDTISNSAEETSFSDAITSTAITSTVQDTPSQATSTVVSSSAVPSNLAVIETFKFFGCLGSAAGYPSFGLVGEGPDMTTAECARLGRGRAYIGIYQRSCYAADTLDSAETVTNGRCDLPCPWDPGLFCGGVVLTDSSPDSRLGRRDAPPGILLTLYAQIEAMSSSLTASEALGTVEISSLTISAEITLQPILTSESSGLPTENPTISNSPSSSTETFVDSVAILEPSVPATRSQGARPITPPFPTTVSYNAGNFTRTEAVVPLITTHQKPPTVEMTTIEVGCNRCGHNGENTISLTVPTGAVVAIPTREYAAHETHIVDHYESKPDTQGTRPKNSSPVAKDSHGQAEPSAVPLGGNGYPDVLKPTFHRRPAPTQTPVIVPDASIVIASGAVVKVIDGMLISILLMVGLVFLL